MEGDQCTSAFFPGGQPGEPGATTDFTVCVVGPGLTYPTADVLPEWCNCTSDMFQRVVDGTSYCALDRQFNSIFTQDPTPVKVPRNFSESGYTYPFAVPPIFIPDLWKNYVGWRMPISAPPSLSVGALTGYLEDSGYLGEFNYTVDKSTAVQSAIDVQLSATGLIESFPRGYGYDNPATPKQWRGSRACVASEEMFTCCVEVVRAPLLDASAYDCPEAYEYAQESVDRERHVCQDCADWQVWPPVGSFTETVTFLCPGQRSDSDFDVVFDYVLGTADHFCHHGNCTVRVGATSTPCTLRAWTARRCRA